MENKTIQLLTVQSTAIREEQNREKVLTGFEAQKNNWQEEETLGSTQEENYLS